MVKFNFQNFGGKKPKKNKNQGPKNLFSQLINIVIFIILIVFIFSLVSSWNKTGRERQEISVSMGQLIDNIRQENFVSTKNTNSAYSVLIKRNKVYLNTKASTTLVAEKESGESFLSVLNAYSIPTSTIDNLNIKIADESNQIFWNVILPIFLPILFLVILFWSLLRGVKGANMKALSFGNTRARLIDPNDKHKRITFKDVAGVQEAKQELEEVVDFLKNPKKFIEIGAEIPKGVLLMGAPGTGKTLLARAVAGEANVPFYHLSGSEFVEMFVGVGASRVRDLFKEAKKNKPSIIFIDEIDAVGRSRGIGLGGGNDEREQTLNQILVEMDGFEPNEKVIVIAATNRAEVLDKALLRPGRFDRRVTIDLPDRENREEILKVHQKKRTFASDVDLKVIAERTPGLSGADLASIINEAAILAARENKKVISQEDLLKSIEKVMMGPERKSYLFSKKEKEKTAYHEAGHALVGSILPNADPIHKVSIIPRGNAGGYTMGIPFEDKKYISKKYLLDDIAMAYGGYAAELEIYGDISTGPQGDLQMTSAMAHEMVMKYGMSDLVGPLAIENEQKKIIYGAGDTSRNISGMEMANKIDEEIKRICEEGLATAKRIIKENLTVLEHIARDLIAKESLEREDFEEILRVHNIPVKQKEA